MQKFGGFSRGTKQAESKTPPSLTPIKGKPEPDESFQRSMGRHELAIEKLKDACIEKGFHAAYLNVIVDGAYVAEEENPERKEEAIENHKPEFRTALASSTPEQIEDLAACVKLLGDSMEVDSLIVQFSKYAKEGIFWLPFFKRKIAPYTSHDRVSMLYAGDKEIDNYVAHFMKSAVTILDAEAGLGLSKLLPIFSGKRLTLAPSNDEGFATNARGEVIVPLVVWEHEQKQENMGSYEQGAHHEVSHHSCNSFVANLHPDNFDYSVVPFEFIAIKEKDGEEPCILIRGRRGGSGEEKEYEIRQVSELYAFVGKAKLVEIIHNILEDRRADCQHIREFPGLEELYQDTYSRVLMDIRKEITNDAEGAFEAFVQVAISGRTKNPIPPKVNEMLGPAWEVLEEQDLEAADASDSLACAFRIYEVFAGAATPKMQKQHTNFNGKGGATAGEGKIIAEAPGTSSQGSQGKNNQGFGGPKEAGKENKEGEKSFRYDATISRGKVRHGWNVVEVYPKGWEDVTVPGRLEKRIARAFKKVEKKEGLLVFGQESGDPDTEAMLEHRRLRKAGIILPPEYYSNVQHVQRSVMGGLLIDFSGSMEGEKIELALSAAAALEGGANLLGDKVISMGFGGSYRTEICNLGWPGHPIKKPVGFTGDTPLGGAVRHMAARLDEYRRRHYRKLAHMMVITDGQPNVVHARGPAISLEKEAVHDSAAGVEEARKLGIKTFGLIILDKKEDEAKFRADYDKIFGRGQYYILHNLEYLPAFLQRYYRRRILEQGER